MEVLAIVGPTGSGKSDLALDLAESIGGSAQFGTRECEVINADAFSLYRQMDIGTAKVLPGERRGIPHHLIDVMDPLESATIAQYQEWGRLAISEVLGRGNLPIVVGGSGLYVRALLDGFDLPGTDPATREVLNLQLEQLGVSAMFAKLQSVDPAAAAVIGAKNARRIVRALEVIQLTGKPYVANLPEPVYRYDTVTIGLDFNREQLDNRITQRVAKMRTLGLLDEVRGIASPDQGGIGPGLGPTAVRAVGYYELLPVLLGAVPADAAFEQVAIHTRQLTRKQMGWFGRDPRIKWLDGADLNLLKNALNYLKTPDNRIHSTSLRTPLGSIASRHSAASP